MGLTRRDMLVGTGSMLAGVGLSSLASAGQNDAESRPFRIAHLTDIHIRPGKVPEESFARALHTAQEAGADLILNGGDAILDALQTESKVVDVLWQTFHRILKADNSLPVLHVVGNHDILGWATPQRDPTTKKETLEQLGLTRGYYSVQRGGWKIIVLDSVEFAEKRSSGYVARLGAEQFGWLQQELSDNERPVCLVSHIPIFSATPFFDGLNEQSGNWTVPGEWMHLDARVLKDLLKMHPQVKLCLSGHIHLADRLDYLNVSYFCNGAVCGNYWDGSYQEFPPAFALVELFPDGRFTNRLIHY